MIPLVRILLRLKLHLLERRIRTNRFDRELSGQIDGVRAALEALE